MRIYLAHTLGSHKYVRENIQPILEQKFEVLNPFYDTEFDGKSEEEIREDINKEYYNKLVERDLSMIDDADNVVAFFEDGASFGSSFEIAYNYYVKGRRAFIFVPERYLHHPWLNVFGKVYKNDQVQEFVDKL